MAKPTIRTIELEEDRARAAGEMTPTLFYRGDLAATAEARIGHTGYSILRTQALSAVHQLGGGFDVILRGLEHLRAGFLADVQAEKLSQDAATQQFAQAGRAVHWQAILTIGIAVENLVATLMAFDCYKAGERDIAPVFLDHGLDLIGELDRKVRRKLGYWELVACIPSQSDLERAGCSVSEAKAFRIGVRTWARRQLELYEAVRAFYTPTLHQLYLRHKHGYSLITPAASPVRLRAMPADESQLGSQFQHGFAVIHRRGDGSAVLEIVSSGPREVRACIAVGRKAVALSMGMSMAWLTQVEHAHQRTYAVDLPASELEAGLGAIRKWIGSDYMSVYPMDAYFEQLNAAREEGDADPNASSGEAG